MHAWCVCSKEWYTTAYAIFVQRPSVFPFVFNDALEELVHSLLSFPNLSMLFWHDSCMFHLNFFLPSSTLFTKFHDRSITFNRTFFYSFYDFISFLFHRIFWLSSLCMYPSFPRTLQSRPTACVIPTPTPLLITDRPLRQYKAQPSSLSYLVFIYQIPLHLDGHRWAYPIVTI